MSFGSNLEKLRKNHKISQAKLANSIGITQQMISSYEKDASYPNMESLIKIAKYFNVSIDWLVDHVTFPKDSETQELQFYHLYHTLSHEDREKCILIINTLLLNREH